MLKIKADIGINFGPGYWKFNNSLLQDKAFFELFTKYWVELIVGFDMDLDLWDHFKAQIKNFTIHYRKIKALVKRNLLKHLEKSYHRLQYDEYHNPAGMLMKVS